MIRPTYEINPHNSFELQHGNSRYFFQNYFPGNPSLEILTYPGMRFFLMIRPAASWGNNDQCGYSGVLDNVVVKISVSCEDLFFRFLLLIFVFFCGWFCCVFVHPRYVGTSFASILPWLLRDHLGFSLSWFVQQLTTTYFVPYIFSINRMENQDGHRVLVTLSVRRNTESVRQQQPQPPPPPTTP